MIKWKKSDVIKAFDNAIGGQIQEQGKKVSGIQLLGKLINKARQGK